jgi:hypothetical protein
VRQCTDVRRRKALKWRFHRESAVFVVPAYDDSATFAQSNGQGPRCAAPLFEFSLFVILTCTIRLPKRQASDHSASSCHMLLSILYVRQLAVKDIGLVACRG